MSWIQLIEAFVLGMIQGLTEFLPISSSGHLYLGRKLFGMEEAGLFLDLMLHIGTLIAVIIVYWRELLVIARHPLQKMTWLLLVATIPTFIIALALENIIEGLAVSGKSIGWEFLITGTLLWVADSIKHLGYKKTEQITYLDALIIGLFQGLSALPAISRSGATIAAALFRKVDKETAASFSFLLSIPAIAAAIAYKSLDFVKGDAPLGVISLPAILVGILSSLVFGYIAVRWMIGILKRGSLKGFALYAWVLGALIIAAQFGGWF